MKTNTKNPEKRGDCYLFYIQEGMKKVFAFQDLLYGIVHTYTFYLIPAFICLILLCYHFSKRSTQEKCKKEIKQ